MSQDTVTLVPAEPRHVETAAPLIYSTGPKMLDYVYRTRSRAEDIIRFCFPRRWNIYAYHCATAAERDGRMIGIELGCDRDRKRRLDAMNVPYHLWHLPPTLWPHLLVANHALDPCIPLPAPGEYYVLFLAVLSEFQGQRIGDRLLQAAFDRAAARGYTACTLDVALTNTRGQRFYERLGMTVQRELPPPDIDPVHAVPGHRRMVKQLT